jgi:uncharacterized membrane protein
MWFHRHVLVLLKLLLGIAALVALVPLSTWAATGSPRQAWQALKGYCVAMGLVVGLAAILSLLMFLGT